MVEGVIAAALRLSLSLSIARCIVGSREERGRAVDLLVYHSGLKLQRSRNKLSSYSGTAIQPRTLYRALSSKDDHHLHAFVYSTYEYGTVRVHWLILNIRPQSSSSANGSFSSFLAEVTLFRFACRSSCFCCSLWWQLYKSKVQILFLLICWSHSHPTIGHVLWILTQL
jgi:hypothetical protein